jgi:hypothetical protein
MVFGISPGSGVRSRVGQLDGLDVIRQLDGSLGEKANDFQYRFEAVPIHEATRSEQRAIFRNKCVCSGVQEYTLRYGALEDDKSSSYDRSQHQSGEARRGTPSNSPDVVLRNFCSQKYRIRDGPSHAPFGKH